MNKTSKTSSPAVGSFAKGGKRRAAHMKALLRKAGRAIVSPSLRKSHPEKAVTLADVSEIGGGRKRPRSVKNAAAALKGFAGIFPARLAKGFRHRMSDEHLAYHLSYELPPLVC